MLTAIVEIIKQIDRLVEKKKILQIHGYFIYFFISLGVIWFGVSSYYYFIGRFSNFVGAAITSGIFIVLCLGIIAFNYIMRIIASKRKTHSDAVKEALLLFYDDLSKLCISKLNKKNSVKILTFSLMTIILINYFLTKKHKSSI